MASVDDRAYSTRISGIYQNMRSESQFSTFNLLKCTYINMVYNFMYQWVGKQIEMGGGGLHLSEIVNKQWLCLTLRKIRGGY